MDPFVTVAGSCSNGLVGKTGVVVWETGSPAASRIKTCRPQTIIGALRGSVPGCSGRAKS